MAHIDDLIDRIADSNLRSQVASEVAKILERTDFGLVFQRHLPEDLEVAGLRPRRGDHVRLKSDVSKQNYVVLSAHAGRATVVAIDGAKQTVPDSHPIDCTYEQLVVVKDFTTPIYPGLRRIETRLPVTNAPSHVVIEGENFHALETLIYTHTGKIDVVYIDPPYNTGKSDWQYNDRYVDSKDAYRHSRWLAFMERRLLLAKRLLSDSGVIFVSIDDNEQAHLRLLMDKIFGTDNFVETLVVEMSTTSGPKTVNAQQGTIVKNAEYVHAYRKSSDFDKVKHTPLFDSIEGWDTHYSLWLEEDGTVRNLSEVIASRSDLRADLVKFGLQKGAGFALKNMTRLLAVSAKTKAFVDANLDRIVSTDRLPIALIGLPVEVGRYIQVEANGRSYLMTKLKNGNVKQLVPLRLNFRTSDDFRPKFGRTVIRGDLWKGFHQDMANVAKEGGVPFNNGKKPIRLIQQLIRWANNRHDAVILDFFGGSGTTTHAVAAMNAEDGGARRSILITNNELSKVDSTALRAQGYFPGDQEFEDAGVFWSTTKPRLEKAIADLGAGQHVKFFKLTYEDENLVALGRKFEAVAPLLWLKAGAAGSCIEQRGSLPWSVPDDAHYGVLFETAHAKEFADAVAARGSDLKQIFIVSDSSSAFQAATNYLDPTVKSITTRLYADYLRSFEINGSNG